MDRRRFLRVLTAGAAVALIDIKQAIGEPAPFDLLEAVRNTPFGGTIHVPPGVHHISAPARIGKRLHIKGHPDGSKIVYGGEEKAMIFFEEGSAGGSIQDLRIEREPCGLQKQIDDIQGGREPGERPLLIFKELDELESSTGNANG